MRRNLYDFMVPPWQRHIKGLLDYGNLAEVWNRRSLAEADVVRLIVISLPVMLRIRRDGQKVLLAMKNTDGEREAARYRSPDAPPRVRYLG